MNTNNLSQTSKLTFYLLIVCAIGFIVSIITPIWSIYLLAPQYPEGLSMYLHANKLAGDVEIINGLNHYIGMKELHADDFWEFTYLPTILGVLSFITLLVAFLKKKKFLYAFTIFYALFGIAFMVDFWWWEYQYGHNLDPSAAIIIPGMSYQPPLFGKKVLLNFTAFSYPNIGGWIMFSIAIVLIFLSFREYKLSKK
ncbi:MAG TPA: hypothetical protein PKN38_04015 [Taishania sp.]|nr:hypothetical protein [Taishania sp.]